MKCVPTILMFVCAAFSPNAFSECPEYQRLFGTLDLKNKEWTTLAVSITKEKICGEMPIPPQANLQVDLTKGKQKFSAKIYRPLFKHWDHPEENGEWSGGVRPQNSLEVNLLVPIWYRGARMKILDERGKTLAVSSL